jgi:hypothetical protein
MKVEGGWVPVFWAIEGFEVLKGLRISRFYPPLIPVHIEHEANQHSSVVVLASLNPTLQLHIA